MLDASSLALRGAALAALATLLACGSAPTESSTSGAPSASNAPARATQPTPAPRDNGARDGTASDRFKPEGTVSGKYPGFGVPYYGGGPMMTGTIEVVPIFYGTSWNSGYQSTILNFLNSVSTTSYWGVVEEYADSHGAHPGGLKILPAAYETDYAFGKNLTQSNIVSIVDKVGTQIAASTSAVYLVLTANDVNQYNWDGSLCSSYLGWHEQTTLSYIDENFQTQHFTGQYAFVGSPSYCYTSGSGVWAYGPNGWATDEAISAAFHELAETATDPDTVSGMQPEIGDICAWVPGPVSVQTPFIGFEQPKSAPSDKNEEGLIFLHWDYDLGKGAPYASTQFGYGANQGTEYLLQTLWDTNQNGCAYGSAFEDWHYIVPIHLQ